MRLRALATVLLLSTLGNALRAADDDARPRYSLREDLRVIVTGSVVPYNKVYADLSLDEKSYVKAQYEDLGANDEPPFPIRGLGPLYKAVATVQRTIQTTGTMTLVVDVDDHGEATSVSMIRSPDPEMTKVVASILMVQKYKPALCNGSPCAMQFPFRVKFDH